MAFELALKGGSYTVDFMNPSANPGFELEDGGLDIGLPEKEEYWEGAIAASPSGIGLVGVTYTGREINIDFHIYGNSRDDIATATQNIKHIITIARLRSALRRGDRTELKWRLDGMTNAMYFEVITGELTIPREAMSILTHWTPGSRNIIKNFTLSLRVKPFAYNVSPVNGSLSAIATNQTIENVNDATYDNFITITAGTVGGDSPAPAEIKITNNDAADDISRIFLCLSREVTGGNASDTMTAMTGTFSGNIPSEGEALLDSEGEVVSSPKVGHYRFFGRATSGNTWNSSFYYSIKIRNLVTGSPYEIVADGPWIKGSGNRLQDLGTLYLPPWILDVGSSDRYQYELWIRGEVGAAYSLNLQHVLHANIEGGFRIINIESPFLTQNWEIIDDAWGSQLYIYTGTQYYGASYGVMQPLHLIPEEAQTLTIVTESETDSEEDHSITVDINAALAFEVLA